MLQVPPISGARQKMSLIERGEENEAVGDDGYRRIRSDVIFGRLAPGQKLRLEKIAQSYGASVSTLREALNRLGSEGLVIAEGHRVGNFKPSAETIAALHRVMIAQGVTPPAKSGPVAERKDY